MATISEHIKEKMIVQAKLSKICPIIPSFLWNIIMGKKMHTEVKVEAVIDVTISCEPKMAATFGLAPF